MALTLLCAILNLVSNLALPLHITDNNNNNTTVLWPLYRSTYVSRHLQLRTGDMVHEMFYCLHALAGSNQRIRTREKTLEFSYTVLPALSPYCTLFIQMSIYINSKNKTCCYPTDAEIDQSNL